ncbi:MAG: metal-dependent hydrolase [Bacteroidetes bacterium]|nr:metal-dependent hydrolase [Bacteroidota bacterium]
MPTTIQLLGHATFKVTTPENKVIIVDPWLSGNSFMPEHLKKFDDIDLFLITHGHDDHFDLEVLDIVKNGKTKVIANSMVRWYLIENNCPLSAIEAMNLGGTISILDCMVTMVNGFHTSHINISETQARFGHNSCGYVLQLSDGTRIYFAGDTCVFGDMKLIGEIYKPTIAVLPIGDRYTMGPSEAAHAIRLLNVKQVIPFHYGTFKQLTGTPEQLAVLTKDIEGLQIHALKAGEELKVEG